MTLNRCYVGDCRDSMRKLIADGVKQCTKCGNIGEFYKDTRNKDGLRSHCKKCLAVKNKEWIKSNPEKRAAIFKRWAETNPSKIKEKNDKWKKLNPEKQKQSVSNWHKANPRVKQAYRAKRRALKIGSQGSYSKSQIDAMYEKQAEQCAACRVKMNGRFDIDHVVALTNGGSNGIENIQLLCPTCNRSKGTKDPILFMQSRGFLL